MDSPKNDGRWQGWFAVALLAIGAIFVGIDTFSNQRAVFLNTLWFGLLTNIVVLPLSILAAWAAAGKSWSSRALVFVCFALFVVPLIMHVSAWDAAFGRLGWLTSAKGQVLKPILSGWSAAVWVSAMALVPQVTLLFLLGWHNSNRTFEEQALLEASPQTVFWRVTVPRLLPVALIGSVWVFIICLRDIAVTDIYRIGTLAEQIYLGYSLNTVNVPGASWSEAQLADAQSLGTSVTLVIIATLLIAVAWMFTRLESLEFFAHEQSPTRISGKSGWTRSIAAIGILLILVLIPFLNLFYRAGLYFHTVEGLPVTGWSLEVLGSSLRRAIVNHSSEFVSSLTIAMLSSVGIMLVASLLSWKALKSRFWKIVFVIAMGLSLAIPGPLIGSGLVKLFSSVNLGPINWFYDNTLGPPAIANVIFCWPIAGMLMWVLFRRIARDAKDSATLAGAGEFRQWLHLGILGNRMGVLGCFLLTFLLCFGELSASQMVLPPGVDTVPRLTLGFLHAGVDEMTAALTIVTTTGIIFVSLVGWAFVRLNNLVSRRQ